ncbi:hypothetical protein Tco_0280067, partial [Tanacetum coccineum]
MQAGRSFVQNYNMHGMGKTVTELHAMLKLHEQTLPNKNAAHALHAIRAGKSKLAYAPKPKIPHPPKKDNPVKDAICHWSSKVLYTYNNISIENYQTTLEDKSSK